MSAPEESIRRAAWNQTLSFSDHALERMGERMITMDQVYECILYGINIETQYHGRDIKVVFQEPTAGTPGHYVIVADSTPFPEIVTVCSTVEEVWESIGGILTRRINL